MERRIWRIINKRGEILERQKKEVEEISRELKEKTEKELEELRKELIRLRALKKKREQEAKKDSESKTIGLPTSNMNEVEKKLVKIDDYLTKQMKIMQENQVEEREDLQYNNSIEAELKLLEQQILGEEQLIEKEIQPYEQLLKEYSWLQEKRYEYMYYIPDKKESPSDYESWKEQWAKILFDYAKYAILHVIYLRKLITEKPFSELNNRELAVKEIAQKLIDQKLAKWLSKNKEKLRIYWKTLDEWADDIYTWAYENGKTEPILKFEIEEANKPFSTLPKEDLEKIYKILAKQKRAKLIKLKDGQTALKIIFD